MTLDSFYDVIIVGAGPAGCTAALYAHKHDLKVLVVDKSIFPRDKVCGDGFMPLYKAIFEELNIDVKELSENSFYKAATSTIYCNQDFINLPIDILLCPRKYFDDFLLNIASSRLPIIQNTSLKEVIFELNENTVVLNANGVDKKTKCKYIIGADGASSYLRRLCNVPKPGNYAVASRAYYHSEKIETDLLIKYTSEIAPGYHWQFRVSKNIINTGIILFDKNKQADLFTLHKKYAEQLHLTGLEIDSIKTWQLPFMNNVNELSGSGYLLIGDAAGLIDPLLGHGIDTGMLSGRLAAFSIFKEHSNRIKVSEFYKSLIEKKINQKWTKNLIFRDNIQSHINNGNNYFLNKFVEHLEQGFIDYTL